MKITKLEDGTILVDYASRIVSDMNGSTVDECLYKIGKLTPGQKIVLVKEYKSHPDARFGDNLIGALQYLDYYKLL